MSSKADQLARQLAELKKSEEYLLGKLDTCLGLNDSVLAGQWKQVLPMLKQLVFQRIQGGPWENPVQIYESIFEKCLKAAFGEDVMNHLSKV